MANDASVGMFGLSFIILRDKSLIESIVAINSLSSFSGLNSLISSTVDKINGSSETIFFI